jgi:hypothetical protein
LRWQVKDCREKPFGEGGKGDVEASGLFEVAKRGGDGDGDR